MRKSLLPVLLLTLFVSGCAWLKTKPENSPPPVSCPAPPRLPPLPPPPTALERSFLLELETILFRSRSEPKSSGLTPKRADDSTTPLGLKLKP